MAKEEIKIKVNEPVETLEEFEGAELKPEGNVTRTVGNFVKQVVRLEVGLVTLPFKVLPARSRYHAKNALHESFLIVRSLVDDVNNNIEKGLTRSIEREKTRAGIDESDIPPAV